MVKAEEVIEIKIPAGVSEGMQLSVSGKGNAARHGGVNGDLLVLIDEEKDPALVRDGNDLICNMNITVPTALARRRDRSTDGRLEGQNQNRTQERTPEKCSRLRRQRHSGHQR